MILGALEFAKKFGFPALLHAVLEGDILLAFDAERHHLCVAGEVIVSPKGHDSAVTPSAEQVRTEALEVSIVELGIDFPKNAAAQSWPLASAVCRPSDETMCAVAAPHNVRFSRGRPE